MTPAKLPGLEDTAPIVDVIPAGALGGLGIAEAVPVLQMDWHDERTGCPIAHRYDAGELQGTPDQYQACWAYLAGRCKMNGSQNGRPRSACLFHEPEDGRGWAGLRVWALLEWPDGKTAITPRSGAPAMAADLGARIVGAEVIRCER